ncbi:MAG: aspartate aminotransferase family protein [Bacteroidota bacterium]
MKSLFFNQGLAQTTPFPLGIEIARAEGIYFYTESGNRIMDFVSGVGVSNLGHGNLKIKEAIHAQVEKHLHTMVYGEFIQASQTKAAALLTGLLPERLNCCYFVNSGTEANEAAIKLVKRATGRKKIISFIGSYHGSTTGSMAISYNEKKKSAFRPLMPGVEFIRLNNWEDLNLITEEIAGVFLETVQGDAGVRIPNPLYLSALRKKCTEVGALLVFDEIQCGMGRTAKHFAFEHFNVIPDILTLGKALGGGLPIGCLVANKNQMEVLSFDPLLGHISTFAGHPVACAAAAAFLEELNQPHILPHAEAIGQYLERELTTFKHVKEIRRIGLYFAVDMESEEIVQQMVDSNLEQGLLSFWFLSCPWSFRIAPPLITTFEEAEMAINIMRKSHDKIA